MHLERIDEFRYLLPKSSREGMRIDGMIYAGEQLAEQISRDRTLEQVANVATLPGLVGYSLAMPDAHQGYGFCIGGVAAADPDRGIVSAGGVGFDINCGVRLLASDLRAADIRESIPTLLDALFAGVPCGTGRKGEMQLDEQTMGDVLEAGAEWAVRSGFGEEADLLRIEESGKISSADPGMVGRRARERGRPQLGTLGSGNHFLEIQVVSDVYDASTAAAFGLVAGSAAILIHSGSRGLGHQVCTDYLDDMQAGMKRHGIAVVDRQLACVPVRSAEGKAYLGAMGAAANFAFANRQLMTHTVRRVFRRVFGEHVSLRVVYDVCHNIAKFEEHLVGGAKGKRRTVLVHRKGATRAFPPGHDALPPALRSAGQPVLIPGSMGTCSYVLVGTDRAMAETFGSSCHGAGRAMSRTRARAETTPDRLLAEMERRGIHVRGRTRSGLTEEQPDAYKDVNVVVETVHGAGIARKVARLSPLAVMKG
ncbi:MAG TPA: RtcB family protein [Bacteroidota bacterium]|nr:RtcB family protein [Bacteroidota bacterium]